MRKHHIFDVIARRLKLNCNNKEIPLERIFRE